MENSNRLRKGDLFIRGNFGVHLEKKNLIFVVEKYIAYKRKFPFPSLKASIGKGLYGR